MLVKRAPEVYGMVRPILQFTNNFRRLPQFANDSYGQNTQMDEVIHGLTEDCSNSIAIALELLQSCAMP